MGTSTGDHVDPDDLEQFEFALVRRGFDPPAVQQQLRRAAAAIRSLQRVCEDLRAQVAEFGEVEELEPHRVAEALGAEATQVLEAAHTAALERAARAQREAEAVGEEAIAAAERTRAEAQGQREEVLAEARREAAQLVEDGRLRGRDMVNEAQTVRERMLGDLARKRQAGRTQVEQLRAGRDRLLESLTVAQQSLDTAVRDLVESVPDARAAAERAGIRIANEVEPTVEHLEAEIEAARLVGHPLVEDIPDPRSEPTVTTAPEVQDPEPEVAEDPEPEVAEDPEPEVADEGPADDIFARLRESAATEPEPAPEPKPEPALIDEARDLAVKQAARALKKVLVDEQGTLLDAIRRSGADAVDVVVADPDNHGAPYESAVQPVLHQLIESLGAVEEPNFDVAYGLLRTVALDPVRHRLIEVAKQSDDPDELSDTVRGLYRESRARRLPEAAQALVAAAEGATMLALAEGLVEWWIDPDGGCGPDCADNALAGAIVAGEAFPTGHVHPPANSTCTCRLVGLRA